MGRTFVVGIGLALLATPALLEAQNWSPSAPQITASATVAAVREFDTESAVNLSFGTTGVTPNVAKTVAPSADDVTDGSGAKVNVRFNAPTRITASGSALTYSPDEGETTYTINPTYTCDRAATATGTAIGTFTCGQGGGDGHSYSATDVTGMMNVWVRVGASISAAESADKPAGAYTGAILIVLNVIS